jgi:hypothetical protein
MNEKGKDVLKQEEINFVICGKILVATSMFHISPDVTNNVFYTILLSNPHRLVANANHLNKVISTTWINLQFGFRIAVQKRV